MTQLAGSGRSASDLTSVADSTPTKSPNRLKQFALKCNKILGSHKAKVIAGLLIGIGIGLSFFCGAGVPLILAGAGLWAASTVSMAVTLKADGKESAAVAGDVVLGFGMTMLGVVGGIAAGSGVLPIGFGIVFGGAAFAAGVVADLEEASTSQIRSS
jgi:hypothetical protein